MGDEIASEFKQSYNIDLTNENSAYRFVDDSIIDVCSDIDIKNINEAINESRDEAAIHLVSAVKLLSDKQNRNYRKSCGESISAIEAIARSATGERSCELSKLAKKLPIRHHQFQQALLNLYHWTSDEGGIRHSLISDTKPINYSDALFFLGICSAFVSYIRREIENMN